MLQLNDPRDVQLSDKERIILRLICEEKSQKEIAIDENVNLSVRTVEAMVPKLREKIGARPKQMAGLVIFAIRAKIVDPHAEPAQ